MNIFNLIKRNKVILLKTLITLVFILFTALSIVNIIIMIENKRFFHSLSLFYFWIIILINFIAEFSPFILYKYIINIIPSFQNYSGRMWPYIIIGIIYMCPELNIDSIFKVYKEQNSLDEINVKKPENEDRYDLTQFELFDFFGYSFYLGILMIITGILCRIIHNVLYMNKKIQENQLLIMSKNYDDFNYAASVRASLSYQKKEIKAKELEKI